MNVKAPQHSITHEPVVIFEDDPAWDFERLREEGAIVTAEGRKAGKEQDREHPWCKYHLGETRYDLEAGDILQYVREGEKPVQFAIRRLPPAKFAKAQTKISATFANHDIEDPDGAGSIQAELAEMYVEMCQQGLTRIEGFDGSDDHPKWFVRRNGVVTTETIYEMIDRFGVLNVQALGAAAFRFSTRLSEPEKKR